jgi:uncharacterized protein YcbK (DUF882 family)
MITLKELNPHSYPTTPEIDANLVILLEKLNKLRADYGKPMSVSSGLRSQADQARINPSAPKSKHLLGAACDFVDKDGEIDKWCLANISKLKEYGLYLESPEKTPGWSHLQSQQPKSGNIVFLP